MLKAVKDGKRTKIEVVDWPAKCEDCNLREEYSCGFDPRFRGRGTRKTPTGTVLESCPQWAAQQPLVAQVWSYLSDYRDGRLGPVFDLPSAFYELLRTADAELTDWTNTQQERLRSDVD